MDTSGRDVMDSDFGEVAAIPFIVIDFEAPPGVKRGLIRFAGFLPPRVSVNGG